MTAQIEIYSKDHCPFCTHAKRLLEQKSLTYTETRVDLNPDALEIMLKRSGGKRSLPQIFINDQHIGGFDDLAALERCCQLDELTK